VALHSCVFCVHVVGGDVNTRSFCELEGYIMSKICQAFTTIFCKLEGYKMSKISSFFRSKTNIKFTIPYIQLCGKLCQNKLNEKLDEIENVKWLSWKWLSWKWSTQTNKKQLAFKISFLESCKTMCCRNPKTKSSNVGLCTIDFSIIVKTLMKSCMIM